MSRRRGLPAGRPRRASAVALLVALGALLAGPGVAAAAPAPAQAVGGSGTSVTVAVDTLAPRVVAADGPGVVVVTGRVVNAGSLAVRDVAVRLQRGAGVSAERDVAAALAGRDPAEEVRTAPVGVAGLLAPGATAGFVLRVPVRGAGSLALPGTGLFPTLVTAMGTLATGSPSDGAPRRLDAERFLLPVLGLPPAPGSGPAPSAPPATATRTTVLYPLVDRPRRVPTVPGAPTLLTDDDLAVSFAPGGRLAGLVDALARAAPVGSPAAASVCLAVDADLLETARVMTGPYEVPAAAGPVAGRGQAAAAAWLSAVTQQARGRCVVAVPYADADLLTTARANLTDLTTSARTDAARRVADLLGVEPLSDATWPSAGRIDERTLSDLATGGARTLVLDAAGLGAPASADGGPVRLAGAPGSSVLALPTDPLVAGALAGTATGPSGSSGPGIGTSPAGTREGLSVQDALATLTMRATGGGDADGGGAPAVVVAPPARWAAPADEAAALLTGVGDLARRGLVAPVDLGALTRSAESDPATPGAALTPTEDDGADDTDDTDDPDAAPGGPTVPADATGPDLVTRTRAVRDEQRDLLAAVKQDRPGAPTPTEFLDPLTGDLLRALSAARRGDPVGRNAAVTAVAREMDEVRSAVRVVQPSGSYSLGANDAPLLLTVENRLPVAVDVDVVLDPVPGLRASPLPVERVPAFGSRQFQVGITLTRSGAFSVDARARTPGGESLGPTSRILLRSTAYGTITVWLTASAAVVLVILASVRITRRVRASRREGRAVSGSGAGSPPPAPGGRAPQRPLERR